MIPLLDWDTPAKKVLEEFPMLEGMTKSELSLNLSITKDDMVDEDAALVRATDILFQRIDDGSYEPPEDWESDDKPDRGVPVLV